MKYLHLVWASLFRRKTRTLLTLVSIIAAFLLFGLLDAVRLSFDQAGQSANGAKRLQTGARLSFIQPLPASLEAKIAAVPGVKRVTYANWFGGAYQDPHNQVFSFAVPPDYLDLFPENWPFEVVGILHASDKKTGGFFDQMLLLNWKYFDETTPYNRGAVGWYVTELADVNQADKVAKAIDALSANSDHETRTQTEQAASASWMKQLADIGLIVGSIMGAVFFTLLLLSGNTMMQAVRERTGELAVLKTIGFSNVSVLAMVLAESVLLLVLGGVIGLLLAALLIPVVSAGSGGMLNLPGVGVNSWILGVGLMATIGLLVGSLPAWSAMRLNIVDALAGR